MWKLIKFFRVIIVSLRNLEKEIIGYRNTYNLVKNLQNYIEYLPEETKKFFEVYRSSFKTEE